jgi:hypothetical protein
MNGLPKKLTTTAKTTIDSSQYNTEYKIAFEILFDSWSLIAPTMPTGNIAIKKTRLNKP